jgi:photosystem II stability/assembly factor-like uncharacterized protein
MSRRRRRAEPPRRDRRRLAVALGLLAAAITIGAGVLLSVSRPGAQGPVAWTRLGTQDVHALAFPDAADTAHLLFGHHGGILQSRDGGRTWASLATGADAMSLAPATDGSVVVAGHEVLMVVDLDGKLEPLEGDLPSLDIHGFTRDPGDPRRMWAYLAEGPLYETRDGGRHWERVATDPRPFVTAVRSGDSVKLLALDPFKGIVESTDGGATWQSLGAPPGGVMSLAATPTGEAVLLGTQRGLFRSDDGGTTWAPTALAGRTPLAIAASNDARTIAAVTTDTEFFRSDDGGATWPGPG